MQFWCSRPRASCAFAMRWCNRVGAYATVVVLVKLCYVSPATLGPYLSSPESNYASPSSTLLKKQFDLSYGMVKDTKYEESLGMVASFK